MSTSKQSSWSRRARVAVAAAVACVLIVPIAALASDRFTDVPDSNVFHDDITWLADAAVTLGCNPPVNDEYCPKDNVTREQMAAFMRRLAENRVVDAGTLEGLTADELIDAATSGNGNTGVQVVDFSDPILVDTSDWVELLSVETDAIAEADMTLAAHVYLERQATANQRYKVMIAAETCEGDPVGVAWWRPNTTTAGGFEADTIALTGNATVDAPTTYVLCAAKFSGGGPDITAHMRGLTATWSPTA